MSIGIKCSICGRREHQCGEDLERPDTCFDCRVARDRRPGLLDQASEFCRRVRLLRALVLIEIGKAIMKLGFRITDAGQEVIRLGAVGRKANQELPKP